MKKNIAQILILSLVFLSILLLYKSSKLEFLELYVYDILIKHHPAQVTKSPVTVITLTENDFRKQKRWEISDALLADIITQLLSYQVSVIGIDVYRDFPVPPGHKKLEKLFQNNQNIIVATKFGNHTGKGFSPPPALKNTNQTGLSDMPLDRDNFVRRGLLYLDDNKSISYSLAFQLVMKHLQQQNTAVTMGWRDQSLHLGSNIIKPFKPSGGGYEDEQIRGFQFLLDFCTPSKAIHRYDLETFQSGNAPIEDFQNSIVLIGTVAESHKDHVLTPCSRETEKDQPVSGVLLHAAVTDQLLRYAQQDQTSLNTASDIQEIIWIFLWTLLGGLISHRQYSLWQQVLAWVTARLSHKNLTCLSISSMLMTELAKPSIAA